MATTLIAATKFTAVDKFSAVVTKMATRTKTFARTAVTSFNKVQRAERKLRSGLKKSLGLFGRLGLAVSALTILTVVGTATAQLDKNLKSLSAITGVVGAQFVGFEKEIDAVSKRQLIFAGDTAKAFELVGSAKPELLDNAAALGKVTEAAIILAKAGGIELGDSVKSLTVSMNQFGVGADKASEFIDILATAQQKGSGTIQYLSEAMVNAGGTSKAFGNSFSDTVAILEGFAKAGVPSTEAGTQLAGILSKLSKVSKKEFNPQYTKATDIINNLAKANLSYTDLLKMTDVRGAKWLTTIINQNQIVQELTGNLNDVGNAQRVADVQTASLTDKWKAIVATFKNAVTTTDSNSEALNCIKDIMTKVAKNMGTVVKVAGAVIGIFIALSAFVLLGNVVLMAYWGILALVTAAQWLWNAAMNANPISLIIIGVVVLIALIALIINKWNSWGAAICIFLGPLGLIISLIQSFRRNWDMIKKSFSEGGILEGFKAIGKVILDSVLMPVQQLMQLIAKIPGMQKRMQPRIDKMQNFREGLGVNTTTDESGKPLNPVVATEAAKANAEKARRDRLDINVSSDAGSNTDITNNSGMFPIKLLNTVGWQPQ